MNRRSIEEIHKRDKEPFLLFNREMIIVIGLGNPGAQYEHNRHNIGFRILDSYAEKGGLSFKEKASSHALLAESEGMLLAKPTTFMNLSGKTAAALLGYTPGDLVVLHDDIDIELGKVKCSFERGAGGHNGVQSIIDALGHKKFFRIRVGVRPVHEELLPKIAPPDGFEKFLLSNFAPFESDEKQKGIERALEVLEMLKTKSFEEVMNSCN
jgi:PTH1 family peptidyl-tRNA hydrolase